MRGRTTRFGALAVALTLATTVIGWAEGTELSLREGVLYGVVLQAEGGKPLAGATAAAFENSGRVIAWGKTDDQGRFALATAPMRALNLEKDGRGGGLLASLVKGVGKVVGTAADVTVGAAKVVAGATVGQSTVAAAGALVGADGGVNPDDQVKAQIAQETGAKASSDVKEALDLDNRPSPPKKKDEKAKPKPLRAQPGQILLRVVKEGFEPFHGPSSVYWMEPPVRVEGKPNVGPQAWLEPVVLATAGKGKSVVTPTRILLEDARLEPNLAAPGSTVKVSAALKAPKQEGLDLRVFLVDASADAVIELKPSENGRYAADYTIPAKHPLGEAVLTLAALRTRPVTVDVTGAKEDPLPRLAGKLDDLKPKSRYEYDPRICASHNRVDLRLTVLDPKKGGVDPAAVPVERAPAAPAPKK